MIRWLSLTVALLFAGVAGGCKSSTGCEAYAGDPGHCNNFVGYTWNGSACVVQNGCLCEGASCPGVYADLSACQTAFRMCAVPDGASSDAPAQ